MLRQLAECKKLGRKRIREIVGELGRTWPGSWEANYGTKEVEIVGGLFIKIYVCEKLETSRCQTVHVSYRVSSAQWKHPQMVGVTLK